jgi:hypothetical protein
MKGGDRVAEKCKSNGKCKCKNKSKCRSFDSAEERSAQDDSFVVNEERFARDDKCW